MNGGRNYELTVVVTRSKSGYMLGTLVTPAVLADRPIGSDNRSGTGNQQERRSARGRFLRDHTPDADDRTIAAMRWSGLHGDLQSG